MLISDAEGQALLQEYYNRLYEKELKHQDSQIDFIDPVFAIQNEVISDWENRYKANQCTRRAGKSYTEVIDHCNVMDKFSNSRNLYLGLTAESANSITNDIFWEIDEKHKIGLGFNKQKKIWTHPNGSTCRMFGVDSSDKEMRKVLGQKLRKVSIDECGSITVDMKRLVYQMIKPALADLRPYSWITLLGTAENIPNTFFEAVTSNEEINVAWKIRKWTAYDNPYMRDQWIEEVNEMVGNNPDVVNASWYKTHYLNEWCADDDLLIIPVNSATMVNYEYSEDYVYVLGVDFGFNDANSFTVVAFSRKRRKAVIVESFSESELIFSQVAQKIKELQRKYNIIKIWVDGANKQGVEEIKQRFKIPLESAEKTDKAILLKLLKDDILTGNVELSNNGCGPLITEWSSLMWKNTDKRDEDPRCQNHCSDSALYAWRYCKHYLWQEPVKKVSRDSNEYMEQLEKAEAKAMQRQQKEMEDY